MSEDHQEEAVVEEQPKRKARRKLVDVIVVSQEGESALVQWVIPNTTRLARGYIEAAKIEGRKCEEKVLAAAQPYGVPWGKLIDLQHFNVTEQRIEDELHRRNMWTVADIENDTQLAMRSLVSIMGPIIGQLHQRGRDYERFEQEDEGG